MILAATLLLGLSVLADGKIYVRNAITDPARLWPNGVIPYTFHGEIDAYRKVHMLAGMKQIMLSTYSNGQPCISFVPRTTQSDYIEIQFSGAGGASSTNGRKGGKQTISVNQDITQDNIIQVLMFAIGIYPEVSRSDRDNVLDIVTSNIDNNYMNAFQTHPNTDAFQQPFDYNTVVMYGPYAFAIDKSLPTIKTKFDGFTIGQAVSLSTGDVELVQHAYKCSMDSSHSVNVLGPLVFECHFHMDFCQFQQDTQDSFDWALQEGPTATIGTGPNADHSSGSGNYALATASGHHNQVARLITPNLPAGTYCFVMFLYTYGTDIGQLRVIQRTADGDKALLTIKSLNNYWYHASATVTSLKSQVSLRIEATIGNGDKGDIAIDDIYIYNGKCIDWY